MAQTTPPVLEIWASHPPLVEEKVRVTNQGNVQLPAEVREDLEKIVAPHFKQDNIIRNLGAVEVGADYAVFDVLASRFHQHIGLNKPEQDKNKEIVAKYPDRMHIAAETGLLPWTGMAVAVTPDGKVLMGVRAKGTVTIGGYVLLGSGYTEEKDVDGRGNPSLFKTVLREYREESDLSKLVAVESGNKSSLVSSVTQHGMSYADRNNRGFGVAYRIDLRATSEEVRAAFAKKHPSEENKENKGLEVIVFTPEGVETYLFESVKKTVKQDGADTSVTVPRVKDIDTHSVGALLLVGRNQFGDDWYQHMLKELPKYIGPILLLGPSALAQKVTVGAVLEATHCERYKA